MDKERLRKLLKDANEFATLLDEAFPKARNRVNSLKWTLKSALEELEKPDAPPASPAPIEGKK